MGRINWERFVELKSKAQDLRIDLDDVISAATDEAYALGTFLLLKVDIEDGSREAAMTGPAFHGLLRTVIVDLETAIVLAEAEKDNCGDDGNETKQKKRKEARRKKTKSRRGRRSRTSHRGRGGLARSRN